MKPKITKALLPVIVGSFCLAGAWTVEAQAAPAAGSTGQQQSPGMMAPGGSMTGRQNTAGPSGMNHPRMVRHGWGSDGWNDRGGMWHRGPAHRGMNRWGVGPRGMGGGFGPAGRLMALVCSSRGTERLEIAFVRLSYRLNLTDQQRPLFDDLKNTAIAEQKNFAETCQSALPRRQAGQRPDPVEILRGHITVEAAKLAAMRAVLPKFEALYRSLGNDQKNMLLPRGMRGGRPDMNQPGRGPRAPGMQPNAPGGGGNMAPGADSNGGGESGGNNAPGDGGAGNGGNPAPAPNSI